MLFELFRAVLAQHPKRIVLNFSIIGEMAAERCHLRLSCDLPKALSGPTLFVSGIARQITDAVVAQIGGHLAITPSLSALEILLDLPLGSADAESAGLAMPLAPRSTMLH